MYSVTGFLPSIFADIPADILPSPQNLKLFARARLQFCIFRFHVTAFVTNHRT